VLNAANYLQRVLAPLSWPILPLWLYCCLTEALLAAVASIAELDLPGGVCRGDPLLKEAETEALNIHTGGGIVSLGWWWAGALPPT